MSTMYRGKITNITPQGAWVEIPQRAIGKAFGPCEVLTNDYDLGDTVLCSTISDILDDLVVLGKIDPDGTAETLSGGDITNDLVSDSWVSLLTAPTALYDIDSDPKAPILVQNIVDTLSTDAASLFIQNLNLRYIAKGSIVVSVKDANYGAIGDGVALDMVPIQSAINAVAVLGGGEVILPPGTYRMSSGGINLASNVSLRGINATITTIYNSGSLNIGDNQSNITIRGITFIGSMPSDTLAVQYQNQIGIRSLTTPGNRCSNINVYDCTFQLIQGSCINIAHIDGFRVENCKFDRYGYAGVIARSVRYGSVSDNNLYGTRLLPSYAPNSYGISITMLEGDGTLGSTVNPYSEHVKVHDNIVRHQAWEALDTHIGRKISFKGNHIEDVLGAGITCIYINTTGPNALIAPQDILIEGNTITYPNIIENDPGMGSGIVFRGSSVGDAGHQLITGAIKNNIIRNMGSIDGSIYVNAAQGVTIEGNEIYQPRKWGIEVRDFIGGSIVNNKIVDVWNTTSTATAIQTQLTFATTMTVTITGNTMSRGNLVVGGTDPTTAIPAGSFVNQYAISGSVTAPQVLTNIVLNEGFNDWSGSTSPSGSATITRMRLGVNGRRHVSGTAAPTSGGFPGGGGWIAGDTIENTAPAANGFMGWVCVVTGSPGTWKSYGAIGA